MQYKKDDRGKLVPKWSSATFIELMEEEIWARRQCVQFCPSDPAYRGAMITLANIANERNKRGYK